MSYYRQIGVSPSMVSLNARIEAVDVMFKNFDFLIDCKYAINFDLKWKVL